MAETGGRVRGPLLVFVHIPKTAGSTLRAVFRMNQPGERTRSLGNVFKGGGGISPALMERMSKGHGPSLRGVGLVRGHFPLGIREYLPLYIPKGREIRCFTFLREPADRTLSHFFQVREKRGGVEGPNKLDLPPLSADASIEDALEGGHIQDNVQTRMLSGLPEPFGEVTDEMLEQAKRNLEDLVFFGLTERFDESLVLAKRRLGFGSILCKSSDRVNATRPRGADVPDELRRAAEACNRYDIELYEHAQHLFDSAPELGELDSEVELGALRAATANGRPGFAVPVPAGFGGDEEAWRMLLEERGRVQNLEWDVAQAGKELSAASSKFLTLHEEIERLRSESARLKELESEVKRLRAAEAKLLAKATRAREKAVGNPVGRRVREGG